MTPNKPDPTNGEEKMRREWYRTWRGGEMPPIMEKCADWWLAQLKQSHLALLEQMIGENEGRRKEEQTDDLSPAFVRQDVKDMCFNSALDLINTDLRAKIEELKKQV